MKKIACEMCGGTDLVKEDGVFVCQSCGMKYSLEEARKMMIEGTVDIQGTVKLDNSSFVEKFLANARRAKLKEDWEETEKYYNMVEQNDPTNLEAIFYSAFGKAKTSLIDADIYKRQQVFKVLTNCVSIIDDNYDPQKAKENEVAIKEMSKDILMMRASDFVFTKWKNSYGIVTSTNKHETITLFNKLEAQFIESLENIIKKDEKVYLYDLIITHCHSLIYKGDLADYATNKWSNKRKKAEDQRMALDKKIREQEREARAERIARYWEEHAAEKTAFEAEDAGLKAQIDKMTYEIENVPGKAEIEAYREHRRALQQKYDSLGIFRGKQKKELQIKIDEMYEEICQKETERKKMQEEIRKKCTLLRERRKEIEKELKKDRP